MEPNIKQVGLRIKNRRKELNLTQIMIKNVTGISSGNLSEIENGNRAPSLGALYKLSHVLDCSIDWIVSGSSPSGDDSFCCSEIETNLISDFRKLPREEKEEVLEILHLKLRKSKKKE